MDAYASLPLEWQFDSDLPPDGAVDAGITFDGATGVTATGAVGAKSSRLAAGAGLVAVVAFFAAAAAFEGSLPCADTGAAKAISVAAATANGSTEAERRMEDS